MTPASWRTDGAAMNLLPSVAGSVLLTFAVAGLAYVVALRSNQRIMPLVSVAFGAAAALAVGVTDGLPIWAFPEVLLVYLDPGAFQDWSFWAAGIVWASAPPLGAAVYLVVRRLRGGRDDSTPAAPEPLVEG